MARRGNLRGAAAAFDEAVARAERHGLWLLCVFALRDMKLCVLDCMGHGAKRLFCVAVFIRILHKNDRFAKTDSGHT